MEDRGGRCEANSGGRGGLLCLSAYLLSPFFWINWKLKALFLSKHLVFRIEQAELLFCSLLQRHLAENLFLQVALARGNQGQLSMYCSQ
jgi:hypothetical protein